MLPESARTPVRPARRPGWYVPAVVAVLVLATGLRFWHLGGWSMWVDEGMTYLRATTGNLSDQGPMYATAPLNFLVTRWIIGAQGPGLFWLRLFPALCGIAGVGAVLWAGLRFAGPVASAAAGLIVALSPWHLDWSQNARHFSAVFLFAVIAVTAYYEYWETGRLGWLVTSAIASALGLLTHSSMVFVIAGMGMYAATLVLVPALRKEIVTRDKVIGSAVFFVILIGGYAPIAITVSRYLGAHKTAWNPPGNILASIVFYAGALVLALAATMGVGGALRMRRSALALLHWMVWPILFVTIAGTRTISSGAYALPSLGAAALLVGSFVEDLAGREWLLPAVAVALGLAADLTVRSGLYFTVEQGNRPPWREAIEWTAARASANDQIYASEGVVVGYYLGDQRRGQWLDRWTPPAAGARQWLLVLAGDGTLAEPALDRFVRGDCRMAQVFPRNTGPKRRDVTIYECVGH